MRGSRIRAGTVISPGICQPPPRGRAFETGAGNPNALGLVRYCGAGYYDTLTGFGWVCMQADGTGWMAWPEFSAYMSAFELQVANNFDPSVSGLVASVGARASTDDGSKCWMKYGAADTAWRSLNETRASVTAAGGPLAALDVTTGAAANETVRLRAEGPAVAVDWLVLRIDGATANGMFNNSLGGSRDSGKIMLSLGGAFSVGFDLTIGAANAANERVLECRLYSRGHGSHNQWMRGYLLGVGAIATSLGIESEAGVAAIGNGFKLTATAQKTGEILT